MWLKQINIPAHWHQGLPDSEMFDVIMSSTGISYRDVANRQTHQVMLGNESVFIKKHFGVGWAEIIKNLLMFKMPVVDAYREWMMLKKAESIGLNVPKALAYGRWGVNPATRHSFVVMEALTDMISLETLAESKAPALATAQKRRRLIKHIASIVRALHQHGIYHRDLYICHFLTPTATLDNIDQLYLIDFHRAAYRRRVPQRWLVKDLASLYFSAWPVDLTIREKLYFIRCYTQKSLRSSLKSDQSLWREIERRAGKLYNEYMLKYGPIYEPS